MSMFRSVAKAFLSFYWAMENVILALVILSSLCGMIRGLMDLWDPTILTETHRLRGVLIGLPSLVVLCATACRLLWLWQDELEGLR